MGRRVFKGIGVGIIILSILFAVIPGIGTNAVVLDEFQMDMNTLAKYTGTATAVSVSDTVKYIGEEAFAGNQTIATIDTGNNTKEIKHGAFANSPYLFTVTTHDNLEKIDTAAFAGCRNLKTVNLGANVDEIGYGVFAGCNNLSGINISRNNDDFKMVGGGLYDENVETLYGFMNGYDTTYYRMPESVKNIYKYSFWGNERIDSVSISPYVQNISAYAFSNCKNLKFVNIPYSVTTIDAKAFENCISLADISIPASVSYIDPTAFDGCSRLNIIADEGTAAYEFFKNFDKSDVSIIEKSDNKKIVIPKDEEKDSESEYNESPVEIVPGIGLVDASSDPSNVEYMPSVDPLSIIDDSNVIAKTVVVGGNAVLFLDTNRDINSGELIRDDSVVADSVQTEDSSDDVIYESAKGGYLPKYTEINGRIAKQAYYANQNMDDYSMPSGINSIGDFAFARSNIEEISIPNGVSKIGFGAFYHCDELGSVSIPATVTDIDGYAFDNTPYMNNFLSNVSEGDFLIVGDGILLAYKGNSANVSVPEGVKKIAPGTFREHIEINNIKLPESLTEIGEDAFRGCNSLTSIVFGNNIKRIEDRAFMGCPVSTLVIPESVESMGLRAVDFSQGDKSDSTKVVVFEGDKLPVIDSGSTSRRLGNENYRTDVLYNVMFAVVEPGVTDYSGTVLDDSRLGFSGLILCRELDNSGNETGNVTVAQNNVFSEDVLSTIPDTVVISGKNYTIKDREKLVTVDNRRESGEKTSAVKVTYNGASDDGYMARFSEDENVGVLSIQDSEYASTELTQKYSELFGADNTPAIKGYDILLTDSTGTTRIDRFGNAVLSITMPVTGSYDDGVCHVITMDEDGQLEEVTAFMDEQGNSITFETSHLSYYGVYFTDSGHNSAILKSGQTVKNYNRDASPDTGDNSISVRYVIAFMGVCIGAIIVLYKKKSIV